MLADLMRNIIEATNLHTEMEEKPLDYEQLQHFFGILLAMTLVSGGERRDRWRTESNGPFPAPTFGRWLPIRSAVDSCSKGIAEGASHLV